MIYKIQSPTQLDYLGFLPHTRSITLTPYRNLPVLPPVCSHKARFLLLSSGGKHAAKSVRTWSSSSYAIVWPGSLNLGSRSATTNAAPTSIRTAPTEADNTLHWLNIGWNYGFVLERAAEGAYSSSYCPRSAIFTARQACGPITSFKRLITPANKPQGFGFAEFQDPDGALRAMTLLNNVELPALEDGCVNKKLLVSSLLAIPFQRRVDLYLR